VFGVERRVVYIAPFRMKIKTLTYPIICVMLLSGCQQLKTLRAHDNSSGPKTLSNSRSSNPKFLDNISVNPGQVVTSKHVTVGPTLPKGKKGRNESIPDNSPAGDIERANWLQLKYAILLDASVEKLANVALLKLVDEWWGTSYCMGGSSKQCIDCSAFVQVIMTGIYGVNLPRTARDQFGSGQKIGLEDLEEGDLVFFQTSGREISHVGVYMLNNKFVHASTSSGVVFNDLNDMYWREKFKGAARVTVRNTSAE